MTFWEDFFEPERFPGLTARVGERRVRAARATTSSSASPALLDGIEAYLARERDLPPSEA